MILMAVTFLKNKENQFSSTKCNMSCKTVHRELIKFTVHTLNKMSFKIKQLPASCKILKWSREQSCSMKG